MDSDDFTMDDKRFMRLAIRKARSGIGSGQSPFAACIVREGQMVVCVHNVVWQSGDVTAHAEIHAIREACRCLNTLHLTDCTIYSTTEPCPMCFSAIHWARISRLVYGADIEDAMEAGFNELTISTMEMKRLGESPIRVEGRCLRDECVALFREWSILGNKPY